MKAKLIKTENGYGLEGVETVAFYSSKRPVHNHYKLSKQNCDEIFGVVDVDSWIEKTIDNIQNKNDLLFKTARMCLKAGFNKAMELNKDKVFTLEDMRRAIVMSATSDIDFLPDRCDDIIQSLQQPNEIEVEIEMEKYPDFTHWKSPQPKLDSEGCLILKRVI